MKNIKNALKIVSVIGLIWSLRVISMDVVPMETSSSAPDVIPMETSSSAPAGTPAKKPAPSESQTLQEIAQMKGQQFPSVLPGELVGMVDKYLYMPQIISAIESAPSLNQALDNINKLSSDVLDKAGKKLGEMLKEKFRDQIDLADDPYGFTPLTIAVSRGGGQEKKIKALLDAGADIDKPGYGMTPLFTAAYVSHEKVVQMLLDAGADIDKANDNGATPLSIAAQTGRVKIVQELLNRGADINKTTNFEQTPLYMAAEGSHEKVVQELINRGADMNKETIDEMTPLFIAAVLGNKNIVKALLDAGADKSISCEGITPLQIAKEKGHTAIVEMLEEN